MAATFTCPDLRLPGVHSTHPSASLSLVLEHTKVPSLITTQIVSPGVNDSTGIPVGAGTSPTVLDQTVDEPSDSMSEASKNTPSSSPSDRRTKRKRTVSPPSPEQLRSRHSRRSTPNSRHSSHRRSATTSLTPATARREDLIALHRESCRLFQDDGLSTSKPRPRVSRPPSSSIPRTPPRPLRSSSNASSPPTLRTQLSISTYQGQPSQDEPLRPPLRASTFSAYEATCPSPLAPTTTVIDWTSPSTRRREYEKIDRASSGVRGFWRRVAPRWCQFGDNRTPFFEEGKNGKGNYEGSIRRFRMEIPEETCETKTGTSTLPRGFKLTRKWTMHRLSNRL
ncbi:uncharacterized protein BO80DRAFT_430066 [Aspergillus ibericus CBS 121593]|uniref:Uncharacterized protein n=1 Tax=Aspergillus ibericus CBS 121593 TaxID=1448316 RepID=A0A395GIZ5_9EURO|nr:hypothetical protein BO80DRAFT_430066 [Aspergillus ibericus CBS 121593]RAK95176.1 hypothetical protein BO80DRAFT_430066 [Aspergillus ibericus CBS 121593]